MVASLNRRTFLAASAASAGAVALTGLSTAPADAAGQTSAVARVRRIRVPFVSVRAKAKTDLTEAHWPRRPP